MLDVAALLARRSGQRVYFDTNIFIYLLGNNLRYAMQCQQLLQASADGQILGLSGDVTLAELLVKPLQTNDAQSVAAVRQLLADDTIVTLISHSRKSFEGAAMMRAKHGLKMVDALQLATAVESGATCFVSNDRQFPALPNLECVGLD